MLPPLRVQRVQATVLWEHDESAPVCGICKQPMPAPCPECQASAGPGCAASQGACGHSYHGHCISRWLRERPTCPMCSAAWKEEGP